MDLKQLRAFLTIAETGNVTRAAEILHLVQPAVSRQVRLLEDDIGQPLFDRERHGMVLTEAGQSLLGYARRAMLELDRARAEIAGSAAGVGGLVTLGLLPSTIDALSSRLVTAINAAYPNIRVRIAMGYAGTLRRMLESGEVDAALLYGAERSPQLQTRPLIEEDLWVIGPGRQDAPGGPGRQDAPRGPGRQDAPGGPGRNPAPGGPGRKNSPGGPRSARLRLDRPVPLKSLAGRTMVLPSAPHGIRTLVEHACVVSGVALNISAETNALSVQRSLVLGGHGLTILPPIAVADDLRSGQLSGAPVSEPAITRTIVLALPTSRPTGAHVRHAVDALVQCTRDAVDAGAWPEGRWLGG